MTLASINENMLQQIKQEITAGVLEDTQNKNLVEFSANSAVILFKIGLQKCMCVGFDAPSAIQMLQVSEQRRCDAIVAHLNNQDYSVFGFLSFTGRSVK